MLEIRKTAIALEEEDLLELEQILVDQDEKAAIRFLKKVVYDRVSRSQQGKLKSHLYSSGDPTKTFEQNNPR